MANTIIQLKYSNTTSTPPLLDISEPAYSNVSNKLWINDGDNIVPIGGYYYTTIIDAATAARTSDTIALRDANGSFSANIISANLNGYLVNARTISLSGDANGSVSFDASQNVDIAVDLTASGVTPGVYGGTTQIPTFTVDLDGRVTSAANVNVATTFNYQGDGSTSGEIDLVSETMTFEGGDGITTIGYAANNTVVFEVDNTVIRTSGGQTIGGDLAVSGNLVISGTTITQDLTNAQTDDSLLKLAANNVADAIDIGFYGQYTNGGTKYAGLVRDASDGNFKLFVGETTDPTNNVLTYGTETRATLDTNIIGGSVSSLSDAILVTDGGTGFRTSALGDIIYGSGTNTLDKLAKPASDSYLKMGSSGIPVWVDTIAVADGGTGNTAFTANHVILGNGTDALTTVGSSTEGHVLMINASGVPQFMHLNGGSF